ncbi:MAG: twin-arginine translocation signal domain-containing protein, partial [Pseudomonadota bacterium]
MALDRDNNHSLQEYFPDPPDGGDEEFIDRAANPGRRSFLKRTGVATVAAMTGTATFLGVTLPLQLTATRALASDESVDGKTGLVVLNDRPLNAETP